ncbi:hypothetical protein P280DRAFT_519412 [Massarina eburnea CBS 473.64]|uniref:Uncharacterized protein n=1 Tax=Massarina eburnea CBS 473.64 TaxID=1395130 RepID=A0A6A6RVM7_9PLEO|nr:hypothetical protein P280DRAFT_519412 [Massarina eburnea CBS 473.64]
MSKTQPIPISGRSQDDNSQASESVKKHVSGSPSTNPTFTPATSPESPSFFSRWIFGRREPRDVPFHLISEEPVQTKVNPPCHFPSNTTYGDDPQQYESSSFPAPSPLKRSRFKFMDSASIDQMLHGKEETEPLRLKAAQILKQEEKREREVKDFLEKCEKNHRPVEKREREVTDLIVKWEKKHIGGAKGKDQ